MRYKECKARTRTVCGPNGHIALTQGLEQSPHLHAPNRRYRLKRKADEDENTPLAGMIREELHGVPSGVLS